MNIAWIVLLYAPPFVACHEGSAQEVSLDTQQREFIIRELSSPDPEYVAGVQVRLQQQRAGTISALMSLVDSPTPDWKSETLKHKAIDLLGEYRAVEACGLLLREIEFHPSDILLSDHPLLRYPAGVALTNIGEPALPAILVSEMNGVISDKRLTIYAYVIWCHYRENEKHVGLFRIKRQLALVRKTQEEHTKKHPTTDDSLERRHNNLERLLEIYQKITPYDRQGWPKP